MGKFFEKIRIIIKMMRPITQLQVIVNFKEPYKVDATVGVGFFYASRKESNDSFTVYIPGFDICFSIKDQSKIVSTAQSAVICFVKFYMPKDGSLSTESVDSFRRKLKGMGFSPYGTTWKEALAGRSVNGQIYINPSLTVPNEFKKSQLQYQHLEVAA